LRKSQRLGGIVGPQGCPALNGIFDCLRKIEGMRPQNHGTTHRGGFNEILTAERAQRSPQNRHVSHRVPRGHLPHRVSENHLRPIPVRVLRSPNEPKSLRLDLVSDGLKPLRMARYKYPKRFSIQVG